MHARTALRFGALVTAVGAATAAYGCLLERNMFTLRRFYVPVLEPDSEPLRILHLSDLHLTPGQSRKREWIAGLIGTDPDLVISTGDHLGHPDAVASAAEALAPLLERPGAFVFGSNDYYGPVFKNPFGYLRRERKHVSGELLPTEDLREVLVRAGWADLNNARATLTVDGRRVDLRGVDDPHIGRDDYAVVTGPPRADAELCLGVTHSPQPPVLDQMAADGVQLILAGHTHGGQVCIPGYGALTTNCDLDRRYAKGLHRWQAPNTWLHVSAGVGTHPTAPVRFACPPEASLLTLVPRR